MIFKMNKKYFLKTFFIGKELHGTQMTLRFIALGNNLRVNAIKKIKGVFEGPIFK
jgi:hypothetical protein